MRTLCFLSTLLSLVSVGAHATTRHVPIQSGVVLNPGATFLAEVASAGPVEIGWTAVQPTPCATNCVEATQLGGGNHFAFATALGGSKTYQPVDGHVTVQYKNLAQQPVTLKIYRIDRVCDAQSCRLFDSTRKGRWLVFKVDEFHSITTSPDASYSVISGVSTGGRPFRFTAVWWTDDPNATNLEMGCTEWIKRFVDNHAPKSTYRPYIISGQNVGDVNNIVLKSIDDCVARADHFGVPDENVFR